MQGLRPKTLKRVVRERQLGAILKPWTARANTIKLNAKRQRAQIVSGWLYRTPCIVALRGWRYEITQEMTPGEWDTRFYNIAQ